MSKRKTVELNLEFVLPAIKKVCRSNVVFCERMGREKQPTWVSGWKRKTGCKNLPSPEEAARMCAILGVTPEEILLKPEDIELVQGLIDQEREKEKPATTEGGGLRPEELEILDMLRALNDEERQQVKRIIKTFIKE